MDYRVHGNYLKFRLLPQCSSAGLTRQGIRVNLQKLNAAFQFKRQYNDMPEFSLLFMHILKCLLYFVKQTLIIYWYGIYFTTYPYTYGIFKNKYENWAVSITNTMIRNLNFYISENNDYRLFLLFFLFIRKKTTMLSHITQFYE